MNNIQCPKCNGNDARADANPPRARMFKLRLRRTVFGCRRAQKENRALGANENTANDWGDLPLP